MIRFGKLKRPEDRYYLSFKKVFKRNLKDYWDIQFGFDLIKFDKDIGTPKGKSTAEFIKENYGVEGEKLILDLLE